MVKLRWAYGVEPETTGGIVDEMGAKAVSFTITASQLRQAGACQDQINIFQKEWPNGCEVNELSIRRIDALHLDINWAVHCLAPPSIQQAYYAAFGGARQSYYAALGVVRQAYYAAWRSADQAYHEAILLAPPPCDAEVIRLAQHVYNDAIYSAQQTYEEAILLVEQAYNETMLITLITACSGATDYGR